MESLTNEIADLERRKVACEEKKVQLRHIQHQARRCLQFNEGNIATIGEQLNNVLGGGQIEINNNRRAFVVPCPLNACNGFLSNRYKCGACDTFVCKDCREPKQSENDPTHTCDPNTVASVQLLKRDSKPCPQCNSMIFRVSGCPQMWCTQCQVAFDWNTGRIDSGPIHNPHFIEYQRSQGRDTSRPQLAMCGRRLNLPKIYRDLFEKSTLCHYYLTSTSSPRTRYPEGTWTFLDNLYQLILHIRNAHIPQLQQRMYRDAPQEDATRDIRIQFIQGNISEEQTKKLLQRREQMHSLYNGYIQIYNMFVTSAEDLLVRIAEYSEQPVITNEDLNSLFSEVESLRNYTNFQIWNQAKRFGHKALNLYITSNLTHNQNYIYAFASEQKHDKPLKLESGADYAQLPFARRSLYRGVYNAFR
ncbi:hypothetical protein BCR44DRAFT_23390 [Catenaria anguillulae PL171]|uniref:RING-type domain-containing protein n=1 Tax=Catenaria anguillulae PL171 TaxID=765915 RepID=A0A1Y2H5T0_9FUNG|nr:hypothetical protein BCR44DRAFT_23390 [Catenaria anguillulae PL171]